MKSIINNNKGQFLARDWVMAIILFSGIIVLFSIGVGSMASYYDNDDVVDDNFRSSFSRFENNTETASQMFTQASGSEGLTVVGTFDVLFKSTFSIISLVFSSVSSFGSQMFSFVEYFGIPSQVGFVFFTIMGALLTVAIVFIVISSVNRRDL